MDRHRKHELRELNTRAWTGDRDVFPVLSSLDSSMKKNTAFIRRLRAPIGQSAVPSILQEIRSLSLNKYLSEIISACYEGLSKAKLAPEIAAGVEVFSALHQRFGPDEFASYVGWLIGRGLSTPDKTQLRGLPQDLKEKEEKDRLARHKVLLRVATELWLVGALRSLEDLKPPEEAAKTKENSKPLGASQQRNAARAAEGDAEPLPLEVLKELLTHDGQHINLSMVAQYFKTFSWDLLGKKDAEGEDVSTPPLTDASMQERFRNVALRYFEGAKLHLVRDQTNVNLQGRRNAEAYVRSGEIFEDRQANYEKMVKSQERFIANMHTLADCLGSEIPDLDEKDSGNVTFDGSIGLVKTGEYLRGEGEGAGIWDDEDERRLYENLIDLKDRVPAILLEDNRKKKGDADEHTHKRTEEPTQGEATTDAPAKDATEADQSTTIANKTVGAQVDALLARLPEVTNKEAIDEVAVDFCFVNSKASRNRLIRAVQDVPRARSDLLPMYSRLVTTLSKYLPDISHSLVTHLDEEFRSLQRRKQKDSLSGVRTSNIRYLAELTKFGIVPEHVIFHCLKVSLDEFSKMNIEIICNLLENCGRYLLRNPETAPRMRSFLETLVRKKSATHLGQQERMLIENATYMVDPPQRSAIQQKERTPLDLFIRKLIYMDLNNRNVERIVKQLRKLHWEEDEVVATLHKIFIKPARIRYSNIHFLAIILGSLNRYHPDFSVSVLDDLLESIALGLELNDFNFNQRRLAEVRYLGELYVYRMIDSSIVFDTMYKIISYGHGGWPKPGSAPDLDPPDDFFRVRLICSILDTCGTYYNKGIAKKKLDFFLVFFQYYIHTKDPMPMDIDFVVQDAFSVVRPEWKILKTLEEAGAAFADACKDNYKNGALNKEVDAADIEVDVEDGDIEGDVDGRRTPFAGEDGSSSEEVEEAKADDLDHDIESDDVFSEDEDEHIIVTRPENERDPEADADFDRELAKMMAESVNETRKTDRKGQLDVALPMRKPQREAIATSVDDGVLDGERNPSNIMQFSLLSKRGNRPQTRNIDLPADSTFAIAHRTQREAEKAEQQRIKALVLNYNSSTNGVDPSVASDTSDGDSHYSPSTAPPCRFLNDPFLGPNPNHLNRLPRRGDSGPVSVPHTPYISRLETKRNGTTGSTITRPVAQPPLSSSGGGGARESREAAGSHASTAGSGALNQQGMRPGGGGGSRRQQQQARKLQLSDVDWYDKSPSPPKYSMKAAASGARSPRSTRRT